jgi:hypothetical protein
MTYDEWRLETPEDEAYRKSGRGPRRGVYTVTVRRTTVEYTTVEVQASSEDDARSDAETEAQFVKLSAWTSDDAEYEATDVEGPPERDPDDARDERMDREMDR